MQVHFPLCGVISNIKHTTVDVQVTQTMKVDINYWSQGGNFKLDVNCWSAWEMNTYCVRDQALSSCRSNSK